MRKSSLRKRSGYLEIVPNQSQLSKLVSIRLRWFLHTDFLLCIQLIILAASQGSGSQFLPGMAGEGGTGVIQLGDGSYNREGAFPLLQVIAGLPLCVRYPPLHQLRQCASNTISKQNIIRIQHHLQIAYYHLHIGESNIEKRKWQCLSP